MNMTETAQSRAVHSYRKRLAERGIVRFELKSKESDRNLLRTLARKLMQEGREVDELRCIIRENVDGDEPQKGGILRALMNSPFAGSDLDLSRPFNPGRKIDL